MNRAVIEQICHFMSEVACNLERAEFDFDFDDHQPQEYNRMCSQYLTKFREEFQPRPQRAFLFEIMCSKNSELTRQGAKQGLRVKRFGLEEGDLRTKVGRRNLFCHLARDRPEHVWISPTCGPWCQWSNLNKSKGAELRNKILANRRDSIWQLGLSRMLCDHQVTHSRQFHLEQPQGSQMLKLPCMQKIMRVTKPSTFDLCRVGDLREPMSQDFIRKRLTVCTTSKELHANLHQRTCQESHRHHQIAGMENRPRCHNSLNCILGSLPDR